MNTLNGIMIFCFQSNANSKNMPFWLDPIWGLEMNSPQSKTV